MTREEIFRVIVTMIRQVVPGLDDHAFSGTDSLDGLGVNSVDRAEIVIATLDSLDLRIPLTTTFGPRNLGELAALLHDKLSQR